MEPKSDPFDADPARFFSRQPGEEEEPASEEGSEEEGAQTLLSREPLEVETDEGDEPAVEETPAADSEEPTEDDAAAHLRRQNERLIEHLTRPPEAPKAETAPEAPGDMPDPVEDREGFSKWLQQTRDYDRHEARREAETLRTELSQKDRANELWVGFQKAYPKHAEHPDLVEFAFLKETSHTGQFTGSDADMFQRVASRIEKLGVAQKSEPEGSEEKGGEKPAKPAKANRTGGVSSQSGAAEKKAAAKAKPSKPKTMGEVLQDQQAAAGFL